MGIHYFFSWLRKKYSNRMKEYTYNDGIETDISALGIDINGLIHNAAQKVYQYGDHKRNSSFLSKHKPQSKLLGSSASNNQVYKLVCDSIDKITRFIFPKKKLILCIDGVAPRSKQNQQRSRRFKAAKERREKNEGKECKVGADASIDFDGNCISPGTKFMDGLSNYINFFIHKKITNDPLWQNLDVIFASEKTTGEGEHNIIQYFKRYCEENDTLCIHGMDADLIMIGLSCHKNKNFFITREHNNNSNILFEISLGGIRQDLVKDLEWCHKNEESEQPKRLFKYHTFNEEYLINDFIFMCFATGNDFLPHVPSIEILNDGLQIMFDTYKYVCSIYGHLTTKNDKGDVIINKKAVKNFFGSLGTLEKGVFEEKVKNKIYFKDELLEKHTKTVINNSASEVEVIEYNVDIESYKRDFYMLKMGLSDEKKSIEKACLEYMKGLQWVLTYYTKGCLDQEWIYPYHYAPFMSDIAEVSNKFVGITWKQTSPRLPFIQLISILPEESKDILPHPLNSLLSQTSTIKEFYPKDFQIDMSGFKNIWEGVCLLPFIDSEKVENEYKKIISKVDKSELRRNTQEKWKIYRYSDFETMIKNYKDSFLSKATCIQFDFNL